MYLITLFLFRKANWGFAYGKKHILCWKIRYGKRQRSLKIDKLEIFGSEIKIHAEQGIMERFADKAMLLST